ncbi:sulfite oxidase [Pararhodobacter sp. SW119]|uniref:sulfite oxidase n=1 Tax=Pararhodobacter sp. SW119 TaxID=2780075 RepID=UPI001AE04962|nr:sulfite oxidase [Pararhodobacter sp. SW119]
MPKKERGLVELYHENPERADWLVFGRKAGPDRRGFLRGAGLASMGAVLGTTIPFSANMPMGLIPAALAETVDEFTLDSKHGDMIVHNDRPVNMETPPHLLDDDITPTDVHFIRNNGTMPMPMSKAEWRLKIEGEVEEELELSYDQLMDEFETVTLQLQIECGGNGRAGFNPLPRGNPWTIGAIGCSEWTGVRLRDVLRRAGLKQSAVYTGHFSYDEHLSGDPDRQAISRGGPIDKMMDPHTLIALKMNGEDIPLAHGYPARIVAPGWAGSVSQKWLTRVLVRDREHDGPGMTGLSYRVPRYPVEAGAEVPEADMMVMGSMIVKSVITDPVGGHEVSAGRPFEVRGQAWAGDNRVAAMETSIDFGATWQPATVEAPVNRYAWQRWRANVTLPQAGYYEVWARATDDFGRSQPMVVPGWNPRGYLNNSCHRIHVVAA